MTLVGLKMLNVFFLIHKLFQQTLQLKANIRKHCVLLVRLVVRMQASVFVVILVYFLLKKVEKKNRNKK